MMGKRFRLFRLFGFEIYLDSSWILLGSLIVWIFGASVYPSNYEDLPPLTYWVMAGLTAVGFLFSILLHELGHASVGRHYGLSIRQITLYLFGGASDLDQTPSRPEAELMIAASGPVVSGILAGFLGLAWIVGRTSDWSVGATALLLHLAGLNLVVALLNVIPALPLDGGRILRALFWYWRRDLNEATRMATSVGSAFGVGILVVGLMAILNGQVGFAVWAILIGLMIRFAARMTNRQILMRQALANEPVGRFMAKNPVTVPRSISIEELVTEYIYRHRQNLYPVVDDDRLLGCIRTRSVKGLPREEWQRQSINALLEPCSPNNSISSSSLAQQALDIMNKARVPGLMVVEGEQLVGVLDHEDLLRFFTTKMEFEGGRGAAGA